MANGQKDLILIAKIIKEGVKRDDLVEMMTLGTSGPKYQHLLLYSNTLVVVFDDAVEMELAKMLLELKSSDQNIFKSIQLRRDDMDSLKYEIIEADESSFNWLCCPCFPKTSNKSLNFTYSLGYFVTWIINQWQFILQW